MGWSAAGGDVRVACGSPRGVEGAFGASGALEDMVVQCRRDEGA